MNKYNILKNKFSSILNNLTELIKDSSKIVGIGLILGVFVYLSLMANNLVNNFDGIWHPSFFIAGDWEISLGRGLQRYADRARFGLVTSSFNSLLVIALITIGDSMIIRRFSLQNFFQQILFVFLSIANPVVCESLTYSYMSVNFALAYLFSVTAFYMISSTHLEKYFFNALLSAVFFAISMSFYQAYINVTLVLIVIYLIRTAGTKMDNEYFFKKIISTVIMLVIGGTIYIAITKALCYKAGITLSTYKGADNVNLSNIILSLPQSLILCYKQFYNYIFTNRMNLPLEFSHYMIGLLIILELVIALYQLATIYKRSKLRAVASFICFISLPVAACFVCIIAIGNEIRGLMATGIIFALIIPVLTFSSKKILSVTSGCMLLLLSFYFVSAVEKDQIALYEGKIATTTLTQNIFNDIYENNYLEQADSIAFIGRAADNPTFRKSFTYETANEYAQFGKWSTGTRNNRVTWEGIINEFCGLTVNMCGDDTYEQLKRMDDVTNMPVYPNKGYMTIVDNVLVIKISDNY